MRDELDEDEEPSIRRRGPGQLLVSGRVSVERAERAPASSHIPPSDDEATIAGVVIDRLGHVPEAGESARDGRVHRHRREARRPGRSSSCVSIYGHRPPRHSAARRSALRAIAAGGSAALYAPLAPRTRREPRGRRGGRRRGGRGRDRPRAPVSTGGMSVVVVPVLVLAPVAVLVGRSPAARARAGATRRCCRHASARSRTARSRVACAPLRWIEASAARLARRRTRPHRCRRSVRCSPICSAASVPARRRSCRRRR